MKVTGSMIGAGVNIYLRDTEISQLIEEIEFIEELEGFLISGTVILVDLLSKLKKINEENKEMRDGE
jgi:hypothetical protein